MSAVQFLFEMTTDAMMERDQICRAPPLGFLVTSTLCSLV